MTAIALPDHLRRFPCMHPWIGSRYRDRRHKRLPAVGESHYLPPESTIHHDPARWYRGSLAVKGHLIPQGQGHDDSPPPGCGT